MNAPPTGTPPATPAPPGPGPWSAPGHPPSAPLPVPHRSRAPIVAGVVVVVIVVLVLGLFLSGILSFPGAKSSSGSGGSSGAMTYAQAEPAASSTAAGFSGGGWALLEASGYDSSLAGNLPFAGVPSGTGCTFTPVPGSTGDLTFPAFTGSFTSGTAPSWAFLFRNATGYVAVVTVTEGGSSVLGTISPACGAFGIILPVPSVVVNSPIAVSAVAGNVSTFLKAHPNANETFSILGGISFLGARIGPEWEVEVNTCPSGSSPSVTSGSEFNATINATSGQVIFSQTLASTSCSGSGTGVGGGPLSMALGPGTPDQMATTFTDRGRSG